MDCKSTNSIPDLKTMPNSFITNVFCSFLGAERLRILRTIPPALRCIYSSFPIGRDRARGFLQNNKISVTLA